MNLESAPVEQPRKRRTRKKPPPLPHERKMDEEIARGVAEHEEEMTAPEKAERALAEKPFEPNRVLAAQRKLEKAEKDLEGYYEAARALGSTEGVERSHFIEKKAEAEKELAEAEAEARGNAAEAEAAVDEIVEEGQGFSKLEKGFVAEGEKMSAAHEEQAARQTPKGMPLYGAQKEHADIAHRDSLNEAIDKLDAELMADERGEKKIGFFKRWGKRRELANLVKQRDKLAEEINLSAMVDREMKMTPGEREMAKLKRFERRSRQDKGGGIHMPGMKG